jgi:hypothetical protein
MAPQRRPDPEQAVARALETIQAAYRRAASAIDKVDDAEQAFAHATDLANGLRETYQAATELRTQAVGRIWEAEELSLAKLAERIGVSKGRADQLVRAHKAAKAG